MPQINVNRPEDYALISDVRLIPITGGDLLPEDLEVTGSGAGAYINVYWVSDTASTVAVVRDVEGIGEITAHINGGAEIPADTAYFETIPILPGEKMNVRADASGGVCSIAIMRVVQR